MLFFPVLLILVFLTSCEKENNVTIPQVQEKTNGFRVVNGFLVFDSNASFIATIDGIANMNDEEREVWESNIGFLSQRSIINNLIEQEIIHDKNLEARFISGEITEISDSDLHSEAYFKALNKGIIQIIDEGTLDEYWDYAIFDRGFVDFINEDGLYAIGDTLYQITSSSLKAMKPADFSNTQILMNAKMQDLENDIVFITSISKFKSTSPGLIETNWVEEGTGKKGDKRIKLGINLSVRMYVYGIEEFQFYHDAYVQCQERNWLRRWKYVSTSIDVDGAWNIGLYKYTEYYPGSWSWNGSASYLKASINPATGSSAPYQSYFCVQPNNPLNDNLDPLIGDQYDYPPQFQSYDWSALRNGGSSGLLATLEK